MAICPKCHTAFDDQVEVCPEHGLELVPEGLFAAAGALLESGLEAGTMVGEYRIQKKLGAGTFGDVYAGEHPLIGKRVAVKVLNQRFASDPVMISRFIAEARAVNKIRQRNIIDIFSFGVLPGAGSHYFVMELLDGSTLGELLAREGRLSLQTIVPIVRGIADALDAVHEAGITHRDLKPDNVFLARERDGSYFPKLLDFGIAKLIDDDSAHKTGPGMVLGTPRYMSPEQARGRVADHRADIYALGVMIHEMLTGQVPFSGQSSVDVLLKHASERPPRVSEVCPEVPAALDAVVLAMLQKDPDERPESAGAAVATLIERARELGLDRYGTEGVAAVTQERPAGDEPFGASDPTMIDTARDASFAAEPSGERAPEDRKKASPVGKALGPAAPRREPKKPRSAPSSALRGSAGQDDLRSEPSTEEMSVIETDSSITRLGWSRRVKIIAASAGALAVGLSMWALGRRAPDPAPLSSATVAVDLRPAPLAPSASAAPISAEPVVKPSDALPDVVELRLATRPEGVEIWLGDRRLGSSSSPVSVPRGGERVELRLKKTGYKDELLAVVPDHDRALAATLSPLTARREPAMAKPPPKAGGKLDRILGDRE